MRPTLSSWTCGTWSATPITSSSAPGWTPRQTQAISDAIRESLKRDDKRAAQRVEGQAQGDWILIDYLDAVVHIFTPEAREFYRLESLWGQVPSETFAAG